MPLLAQIRPASTSGPRSRLPLHRQPLRLRRELRRVQVAAGAEAVVEALVPAARLLRPQGPGAGPERDLLRRHRHRPRESWLRA